MRIDFDRIVPKYRSSEIQKIASIVTDNTQVDFFLEECEKYGILWGSLERPTEYNPRNHYPNGILFRFVLFDYRHCEDGAVELAFEPFDTPYFPRDDDILLTDLLVDDEIEVSSEPPIPLDLSSLFREVLK